MADTRPGTAARADDSSQIASQVTDESQVADKSKVADKSQVADERASQTSASGNYWDYCPNCSSRLHNRGCKYRCPKGHYFMSCSDFDQ